MLLKLASSALFVLSLVNLSLADAKVDHEVFNKSKGYIFILKLF